MTTTSNATLVISRGELYFDRFAAGTMKGEGELYLGNTPGFTVSRTVEEVERFTSYGGQQIQIDSLVTREVHTADITTDNVSVENLALWFGSEPDKTGQVSITYITETFEVKEGRWYQLGTSVDPFGVRHVEPDITFKRNGNPLKVPANLILDLVEGRFYVLDGAPNIADGNTLTVTFQWRRSASVDIVASSAEVVGSLRYMSKNPFGPSVSYFFPYVRLKPASQIEFKADDWQNFSFDVDIRKLNASTNFVYAKQLSGALMTSDEQAIIELGPLSLEEFPYWEDQLSTLINKTIPGHRYGRPL